MFVALVLLECFTFLSVFGAYLDPEVKGSLNRFFLQE